MKASKLGSGAAYAAALALLAGTARAQTTGGISGQIVDGNTQNAVPDAVVIATSPSLQGEQTAVTDSGGNFEITLLPAGTYRLTVQREGYQPFTQEGLTVRLDRTIKARLVILPDQFQGAPVEIVAQRPVISVSNAQTGGTVSKEQMNLVPYGRNARNFEAVATSIPGVQTDTYGVQMNGSGSPETSYIIDGVQVNDPGYGTQGTTLIQDFIQEVDIKTGGYQAEYGRASGGVINVVTKSGGNEFHGSVFANWSPYEAPRKRIGVINSAVSTQVSQRYNLDFGAELGGPILKDRLWFFAGFAPQLVSVNMDRVIQAQQLNPTTGTAVLDPATGLPQTTDVATQRYTQTTTSYQFTGKLTYLLNENHNVAAAVYGNPTTQTGPVSSVALRNNLGWALTDVQWGSTDVSLRYSGKLFNKTMLVEATGAYHRQVGAQSNPTVNFVSINGIPGSTVGDTPTLRLRTTTANLLDPLIMNDPFVPEYQKNAAVLGACAPQGTFNPCPVSLYITGGPGYVGDIHLDRLGGVLKLSNFVELAGHHQFKYGLDAARDTYDIKKYYSGGAFFDARYTSGVLSSYRAYRAYGKADPDRPGQPLVDQATGRFVGSTINTNTKNTSLAAFAQDTWNIFDKVVLDIGIRAEKQMMYPDPNTLDENGNRIGDKAGIDLTNVMPRIGLIYDFTGRGLSKAYASFGRFYEYVPLDLADRALSAETQVIFAANPGSCANPNDPRTCTIIPNGVGGRTYTFIGQAGGTSVDPKLKGQYADEYQAGVQYQLYRDISVGVEYTRKQIGRVIEDMSVDDGATYFLANPGEKGTLGEKGTTGAGTTILEPKPRRIYDAVTLSMNKQLSDNYLFTASYTYSSFRGNYPGLFRQENGQLDPNILSEYDLLSLLPNKDGPLPGDVPNSFKGDAAYIYELNAKTTLNLGGSVRVNQGVPYNYLGAHPDYGSSEAFILPRGSGGRLPWNWQVNLRGAAGYRISKDYNLSLSVDLFNVTNNRATTNVDQNYTFDSVYPIVNGTKADLAYLKTTAGVPVTRNLNFGNASGANGYQLPFSARVGAKLSF